MQHFNNGGEVEYKGSSGWMEATSPGWNWEKYNYRIAEEQKPEHIDWMKTGWVKHKETNIEYMITSYDADSVCPYYVSDRGWYPEEGMTQEFDPCESPIGK